MRKLINSTYLAGLVDEVRFWIHPVLQGGPRDDLVGAQAVPPGTGPDLLP